IAAMTATLLALAVPLGVVIWKSDQLFRASQFNPPEKSIAILPFLDLSQAKDQEYFCDGISEEILDTLAKVDGLRVLGRTSSFSFKGKSTGASEVGKKLNVENVLEGSLQREGNRIRVTAELINARNGFHVWSETYEREVQGVFALQDEITRAIVEALKIKLAVSPPVHEQRNTEVYDLYLQGLFFSNKSSEADLRRALRFFQGALEKDPTFSRAWTGIAKVWYFLADVYVRPFEAYPASREAALKAIALDEKDSEAHCYLSEAKRVLDWDLEGQNAELNRALQLDPNSAPAHFFLSLLPLFRGELQEGLRLVLDAEKLDPVSPITCTLLPLPIWLTTASTMLLMRASGRSCSIRITSTWIRILLPPIAIRATSLKRSRSTPNRRRRRISPVAVLPSPTRAWAGKWKRRIFSLSFSKPGRSDMSRRL